MRNFQKKKRISRLLESKPVLVILGLLVAFFAYNMLGLLSKMRDTSKNKEIAEAKVEELEVNKATLSQNIEKLSTPAGVEASIREKYGVAKQGEGVIMIVEDRSAPEEKEEDKGFFSFFTNWFK